MRNLKRVLGLVMAVAMLMSLMTFGAGATFADQNKIKNDTAVNMNVALGIINGKEDNKFDPEGNVTRAEMAKMICVALNGGKEPTLGTKINPSFNDIKGHWAEAYIEYCSAMGIVAGMGDGSFNPNGNVTATQAAKMMLVALGYDADTEGFNGTTWAVKINVVASQNDLYKDLAIDPNASLIRDDAAQLIWNGLNAKMVKYVYSLTSVDGVLQNIKIAEEYSDNRTMLSNKYNQKDFEGTLTNFSYNSTKEEWTYTVDGTTTETFTTDVDFTALYGQNVKVVYKVDSNNNVDSVFGIYAEDSAVLFSGIVNDLTIKTDGLKIDGTTYDLDSNATASTNVYNFAYNTLFAPAAVVNTADELGVDLSGTGGTDYSYQLPYTFEAIDTDGDGDVNFVMVYPFTVEKVSYVGSKNINTNGVGSPYTIEDCDVFKNIAKDDYTKVTAAGNTATNTTVLAEVDDMVAGEVNSRTGSKYFVDGIKYYLTGSVTMSVGDTVKDAAVVNGFIFDADTSGTTDVDDYAVIISAAAASGVTSDQVKLMFADGTKKVVDADKDYSLTVGKLVTYDINSDDEYELTEVTYVATGSGYDKASNTGNITGTSTSNEVKYINDWNVDKDAVIFVYNSNDSSYEVISGSTLMDTDKTNLSLNGAFANDNADSGYNTVELAFINTTADLKTADSYYGYALADFSVVKNSDDKNVYQYTLFDGTSQVKVMAKSTISTAVYEGDVVEYTLNSDGEIDTITAYSTDAASPSAKVAAITAYDGTYIQLNNATTRYEIDKDDTVIIYVDNDNIEGAEDGSIQLATKAPGATAYGNYYANAIVLFTGTDVDLIIVDNNNDILNAQ